MFRVLGWICAALLAATVVAAAPATATTGQVPEGFAPSSTSWLDGKRGFVLGFAPCAAGQCPALARTSDGGASWRPVPVPPVRLISVDRRVRVQFATELDGVITDGQAMYATHTGGRLWRRVVLPGPRGDIGALASNGRALYAIVSGDTGTRLLTTPLGLDRWHPVPGVELAGRGGGTVVAQGDSAYVALNVIHESIGYWTTANGRTWRAAEPPCPAGANPELDLAGSTLFALCSYNPGRGFMFKDLMRSEAGGAFAFVSNAPEPGITTDFAAASPSTVAIGAIGAGATWLHRSSEGAAAWDTPLVLDEVPLADLAFPGEQEGVVVWGGPLWGAAQVYRTQDGGATWLPLTFG